MMTKKLPLITNYVLALCFLGKLAAAQNSCTSPNGQPGACTDLFRCKAIWEKIRENPLSGMTELYQSSCPFNFFTFQVCCPSTGGPVEESSAEQSSEEEISSEQSPAEESSAEQNASSRAYKPLYPPNCGFSNAAHNKIVGGRPSVRGAWPWIAALGIKFSGNRVGFFCGGALVSSRHVVTAAHCMEEKGVTYLVRLGAHNLASSKDGATDVLIEKYIVHPRYNKANYENDIAVLRMRREVKFTRAIHPICLPLANNIRNRDLTGTYPFIAGWGATQYEGSSSDVLREVQVPVVPTDQCRKAYSRTNSVIDQRVLCAGYAQGGRDSCQGDSGGPLMFPDRTTWYIVGVVSSGYKCAAPGYPGIYTRTTAFLNFVQSNLN